MAQLAVAGGGAAVGAIAGSIIPGVGTVLGAQIGWAVGGIAGALLFPPKGNDTQGPRLNDLSVQTSGFGVPIPVVAGQAKLAGNIIWKKDITERKTTRRQGKGGGGPKVTTFSYFGSWAVGLCEWLIPPVAPGVLRIWLDNKLVFDATGESDTVQIPGLVWRFYPGSATQFPDPLIEATVGATDAPAHRGLAYIVFDDVPLDRFGNRVPQVTVELVGHITRSFPQVNTIPPAAPLFASSPSGNTYGGWPLNVAVDYARGRIYEGRRRTTGYSTPADELIRVYDLVTMETLGEFPLSTVLAPVFPAGLAPAASNSGTGLMHLGVDGFLYVTGGTSNRVPLFKVDPDAMLAVGVWGDLPGPGFGFGGDNLRLINPMQIVSVSVPRLGLTPRTFVIVQGSYSTTLVIDADTMTYVWGASGTAVAPPIIPIGLGLAPLSYPVVLVPGRTRDDGGVELWYLRGMETTAPFRVEVSRLRFYSGAADLGGGAAMGIFRDDYTAIDVPAAVDASANNVLMQSAYWDFSDDTLVITISGTAPGGAGSYARFSTFKWAPGSAGVVWKLVDHALPGAHDGRGQPQRVLGATWGLGGNLLLQTGSGDALVNAAGTTFKSLSWLDEQQATVGYVAAGTGAREVAKRYLSRVAPNALTVAAVVEALCLRAGLQITDVDVTALTDPLRGYLLARPMSARDAITPLAAYTQADAVEQDNVILFRKRAGATVAALAYDDLVREDTDGSVIEEQRAQDADLPREVTTRYADIERGWEQGAQSWRRPLAPTATMQSRGVAAIDLPMPLTATEAKTVARRYCIATWRERTRLSFAVGPRFARLVPTDPITIGTRDGATIRCRILSAQLGANWATRIEAVTEDAAIYGLTATGDAGSDWDEPLMPMPYSTRLVVPDLALIEDGDDLAQRGLREYAFACAYGGTRWRGVTVIERGGGAAWEQLGVVTTPVEWGSLIAAPTVPGTPWTWDETGVLRVRMTTGEPESATSLEVLNGANRAALVAADGTAEIVQWRTAAQQADGTWTLSGLLRGRRGTEDRIASRRIGDLFLILDGTRLLYDGALGEAAVSKQMKAVSIFDTPDTAPGLVVKARRGRAEQPYAVAAVAGSRDGSNNLTLTWVRRTRVGGELLDGTGVVPVSEVAESYEIDVLSGPPPVSKSYFASEGTAANAFDGSAVTEWIAGADPFIVGVTFVEPQTVRQYEIVARSTFASSDSPRDWTFESFRGQTTPFGNSGTPANLIDGASSDWVVPSLDLPRHGGVTFPFRQTVAQYGVRAGAFAATDAPRDWTLEGSDDLAAWVLLDTRAGITGWTTGELRTYTLAAPVSFFHYRINVSAGQSSGAGINMRQRELELYETVSGFNVTSGWQVLDSRASITGWTNGMVRTYDLAAPATNAHFRFRGTANNGGGNRGFAELRMRRGQGANAGNIAAAAYAPVALRTITQATPSAAYSAANQTTDFGAVQAEVFVRVHQMSGVVGRGIPAEAIL